MGSAIDAEIAAQYAEVNRGSAIIVQSDGRSKVWGVLAVFWGRAAGPFRVRADGEKPYADAAPSRCMAMIELFQVSARHSGRRLAEEDPADHSHGPRRRPRATDVGRA